MMLSIHSFLIARVPLSRCPKPVVVRHQSMLNMWLALEISLAQHAKLLPIHCDGVFCSNVASIVFVHQIICMFHRGRLEV